MVEQASVSARYTAAPIDDGRLPELRLTLEPEYIDRRANLADLADIDAMLNMAMSGLSAVNRQIDRCRWARWTDDGSLIVTLALYVWPSEQDLRYELHLPPGVTSAPPVLVREQRHRKYWINGGKALELPWYLEGGQFWWHPAIGCMDAWSQPIAQPGISQNRARLEIDAPAYGVLVTEGIAVGWRHDISITYRKIATGETPEEDAPQINTIEADDIPIRATWTDENSEEQEESTNLVIPACAKSLLETCSDGRIKTTVNISQADEGPWVIYYSTCDGHMLARRRASDASND